MSWCIWRQVGITICNGWLQCGNTSNTQREVSRARWRCAASHTRSLLDETQRVLRPYVCSREDSEAVFHSLFYALLTPSYSRLFSGKRHCLFTDARFPYTISAPLFGGMDRHSLNSRTQEVVTVCSPPPPSWPLSPVTLLKWEPPVVVVTDASGHDGCIRLKVGSRVTDNTTISKGESSMHQPKYGWYAKMTVSQSSYSINSGQPRAHWGLLHGSRLHARISPWVGMPLKVTPQGWENLYHVRYSVSELGISTLKLWNLS